MMYVCVHVHNSRERWIFEMKIQTIFRSSYPSFLGFIAKPMWLLYNTDFVKILYKVFAEMWYDLCMKVRLIWCLKYWHRQISQLHYGFLNVTFFFYFTHCWFMNTFNCCSSFNCIYFLPLFHSMFHCVSISMPLSRIVDTMENAPHIWHEIYVQKKSSRTSTSEVKKKITECTCRLIMCWNEKSTSLVSFLYQFK